MSYGRKTSFFKPMKRTSPFLFKFKGKKYEITNKNNFFCSFFGKIT
jgi:hypothetical protein